jgi:hypothetical protein
MAKTNRAHVLSDKQVAELLHLLEDVGSVELKMTVPEADQRTAVAALQLDPLDAQIRQVYFFDTPDLALETHGLVVRARRVQGKGGDSVVKLRPVVPAELPGRLRRSRDFYVEVDATPGAFVCSGSMKRALDPDAVKRAVSGKRAVSKLFSKEQRAFFAEHAPDGVGLDDLAVLGPIFVLKVRSMPKDLGRRLVAELWLYPDNKWILELSAKCVPDEAFQVAAKARAYLTERGVDLGGEQQTKTRTALEFFSRRLSDADVSST